MSYCIFVLYLFFSFYQSFRVKDGKEWHQILYFLWKNTPSTRVSVLGYCRPLDISHGPPSLFLSADTAAGSELFQLLVLHERWPALRFQLTCLSQALLTGVLPKVSINILPQPGSSSGDLWGGAGRICYLWPPNPAGQTDSCCSATEIWRLFNDKTTEETQRESELLSIYEFRFEKSRVFLPHMQTQS